MKYGFSKFYATPVFELFRADFFQALFFDHLKQKTSLFVQRGFGIVDS